MNTKQVLNLIEAERNYQNAKWGNNPHSNEEWSVIASEEAGEVSRAILNLWKNPTIPSLQLSLLQELVQQMAVLAAWIEDYSNGKLQIDADAYIKIRNKQAAALINEHIGRHVINPDD